MHSSSVPTTTLQPHHLSNLINILRDANDHYQRVACATRATFKPRHHAKRRAAHLGLKVNIDRAVACPQKQVSHIPLPVLDICPSPKVSVVRPPVIRAEKKRKLSSASTKLAVKPVYHLSSSPLKLVLPSPKSRLRKKRQFKVHKPKVEVVSMFYDSESEEEDEEAQEEEQEDAMFDIQLTARRIPDVPEDCAAYEDDLFDSEGSSYSSSDSDEIVTPSDSPVCLKRKAESQETNDYKRAKCMPPVPTLQITIFA